MSITIRPEREQAEHDRLIHFLQAKYKKYDAIANPGDEQNASIKVATRPHFPDLVLNSGNKVVGVVEIETAASVNRLETMYKWVPFSRARVPFHLYVPVQGYDTALRLAETHRVKAAEIWTYRSAVDGFDLVRMHVDTAAADRQARAETRTAAPRPAKTATKPKAAKKAASRPARAKATAKSTAGRPAPRKAKATAKKTKAAARPAAKRKPAARPSRPTPRKTTSRAAASSGRRSARTPVRAAKKKGPGARTRR